MPTAVTFPNYQFTNPWAYNTGGTNYGGANVIPLASSQPNASLADGFPKQTMLAVGAGGTPPAGADFNGILNAITQHLAWVNAGGQYFYSSALSYNVGAVVQLGTSGAPGLGSVVSTVNVNTYNPNGTQPYTNGWAPYSGNTMLLQAAAMPTSGYWVQGNIVWNSAMAHGSPIGWARVTTGSSNVLNTDWYALSVI